MSRAVHKVIRTLKRVTVGGVSAKGELIPVASDHILQGAVFGRCEGRYPNRVIERDAIVKRDRKARTGCVGRGESGGSCKAVADAGDAVAGPDAGAGRVRPRGVGRSPPSLSSRLRN